MIVDAIGGPEAYERRSDAQQKMNLDDVASYQADATTKRPRPVFICEMARKFMAPTLLSNAERSPSVFHLVVDQLERCLPNRERVEIPASGHTVPWENPDAYDKVVLSFMKKH
ncbi:alpha/beta fold hydrolase [Bradyrhizobium sp. RD5-C2]|uniref:alpha/beta fold hydrolase n=1 Tax=Bradyrhizobium sp. RD5-C2 TaxID=244562 RepID=UPI001CC5994B|nr:alpha/beta hydrolase [Bradyrhizobium sp. RD5-C2]